MLTRSDLRSIRRRKRRTAMLVSLLKRSVQEFNAWREQNPKAVLIFEGLDLSGLDLTGINLEDTNLVLVNFRGTNLTNANLSRTDIDHADFIGAITTGANFEDAFEGCCEADEFEYGLELDADLLAGQS